MKSWPSFSGTNLLIVILLCSLKFVHLGLHREAENLFKVSPHDPTNNPNILHKDCTPDTERVPSMRFTHSGHTQ